MPASSNGSAKPRVVIVGAGFGGIAAAKNLAKAPVDVTIIDRRNFHLFQPLLYQVATAALSPSEIAMPIRSVVKNQHNTSVVLGRVTGVDIAAREVLTDKQRVPYDFLILATGARHDYFGREEWEPHAPGLKKIDDAVAIRRRILEAFEWAETEADPAAQVRLLTFVVVGGGATGVEMAGAIAELAKKMLTKEFRNIEPHTARVVLVEAGPKVLAAFPAKLSGAARRALERLGVEVRLGHPVSQCDGNGVEVDGQRIEAHTVIWAAGVIASPAAKWLDAERDRVGRVVVEADLSVPGHRDIFVIGDTALALDGDGKPLPGVAAVAKQQGRYLARLIRERVRGNRNSLPFRYRDFGSLATIGRKAAVAHVLGFQLSGRLAWVLWGLVHIYFLVGARNRFVVTINWIWAYLTFQFSSRLIIGDGRPPATAVAAPAGAKTGAKTKDPAARRARSRTRAPRRTIRPPSDFRADDPAPPS